MQMALLLCRLRELDLQLLCRRNSLTAVLKWKSFHQILKTLGLLLLCLLIPVSARKKDYGLVTLILEFHCEHAQSCVTIMLNNYAGTSPYTFVPPPSSPFFYIRVVTDIEGTSCLRAVGRVYHGQSFVPQ